MGESHAVCGDASHVRAGDGVVRVDRVEQRLERRGGEARRPSGFTTLSNDEGANAGAESEEKGISHDGARGKKETWERWRFFRECPDMTDHARGTSADITDQTSGVRRQTTSTPRAVDGSDH
jgi:hypothetical protein